MLRIATFGGVQPAALAELTEVLNGLLTVRISSAAKWAA